MIEQQVVDDFNASQTTISLTLEVVPYADAYDELMEQIVTGNPPDIVGPVGIEGANYYFTYWLDFQDLITSTGYDMSDFDPDLMGLFEIGSGGITGLPITVYPSNIYYNEDLFDTAGLAYPPHQYGQPYTDTTYGGTWNVDKLEEIARLLTLDNLGRNANDPSFDYNTIVQFGFQEQWGQLTAHATLFGAGCFADVNGDAQIPTLWQQAINWYYNGMWADYFIPNDPYVNNAWFDNGNTFNSGHLAMSHTNSWYVCCLGNVTNWDIAATPSYSGSITSQIDADTFRIIKFTQYPSEAFEALTYLVGDAAVSLTQTYNGFPARMSLQAGALSDLGSRYPGVDWQVLVDSIDYLDDPNHEGYMPNHAKAVERVGEFAGMYLNNPGININNALDDLREDLQIIFHERKVFLPLIVQ